MLLLATARFMAIFGTVDWKGAGFAWYWFIALGANASWFCCGTAALSDWAWSRNHDVKLSDYMYSFCINVNPTSDTWGESWPRDPGMTLVFFLSALKFLPPLQPTYRTFKCTSENNQVSTEKQHRSLPLIYQWRYWINCALIITDK